MALVQWEAREHRIPPLWIAQDKKKKDADIV